MSWYNGDDRSNMDKDNEEYIFILIILFLLVPVLSIALASS
jgi:nitrate reductase NapE component